MTVNFFARLKKAWHIFIGKNQEIVTVTTESDMYNLVNDNIRQFEQAALLEHIKGLEKVIHYLAYRIDVQTETLKQNTAILTNYSSSIEELTNFLDQINSARIQRQQTVSSNREEDFPENVENTPRKKFLN